MVVREPAQRLDVLAHRVGPDHDLDAVVAEPCRDLERAGGRLGIGRRGGERHLRRGHPGDQAVAAHHHRLFGRQMVEPAEDEPFAQRPRADVDLVTPSRSMASAATGAGASSWRGPVGETPGSFARSAQGIFVSLEPDPRRRTRSARAGRTDPCCRGRRRRSAPASGTSCWSRPPGSVRRARRAAAPAPRSGLWRTCAARRGGALRRITGQPVAGQPAGSERQAGRDVGILVLAARDLERAAADVEGEQTAGAPAEPAADGQERQPGLVVAGQHLQVDAGRVPDVGEHLGASSHRGRRRWRTRAGPRRRAPRPRGGPRSACRTAWRRRRGRGSRRRRASWASRAAS